MTAPDDGKWERCDCCGGDIPPESTWGQDGEAADGYCPGRVNPDGVCGAFGPRCLYAAEVRT